MITTQDKSAVTRGGTSHESTFAIKASSKAFDILSSALYSNKILAIVRELSCNAYDAHVAVGKKETPIEIRLPSFMDPTFYVRDYGTGLSHEQIAGWYEDVVDPHTKAVTQKFVLGIYQTFFDSSKTDSNEFIGALGLGSKSPFSYTSAFVVISRYNGVKRTYSAFKNEEGLPSIVQMGEEVTDECNGLQVSMAVKKDDVEKFHEAAKKALMYFTPQPKVIGRSGFKTYDIKHIVSGGIWKVRQTDYYAHMRGPHVVQGFVAYPIDTSILRDSKMSAQAMRLMDTDLDMYVAIGKVEVAPSREALSYTKATTSNLVAAFEHVATEIRASFQSELDKCATHWDAAVKYIEFSNEGSLSNVFNTMHNEEPFKWKGAEIDDEIALNLSGINSIQILRQSLSMRGTKLRTGALWEPANIVKTWHMQARKSTYIVVDTEVKGNSDIIRQFLDSKGGSPTVVIFRAVKKGIVDQKEIDNLAAQMGNPTVLSIADLGFTKTKTASSYVKKDKTIKLVWDGFKEKASYGSYSSGGINYTFSNKTWRRETIDMNDGGIYVPVERFSVLKNGTEYMKIDELIKVSTTLGFLDVDDMIVGLNEKEVAEVAKNKKWVTLFDHLDAEFKAANSMDDFTNRVKYNALLETSTGAALHRLLGDWTKINQRLDVDSKFRKSTLEISSFMDSVPTDLDVRAIREFAEMTGRSDIMSTARQEGIDMAGGWMAMLDNYPMTTLFNWSSVGSGSYDIVFGYIADIDEKMKESLPSM